MPGQNASRMWQNKECTGLKECHQSAEIAETKCVKYPAHGWVHGVVYILDCIFVLSSDSSVLSTYCVVIEKPATLRQGLLVCRSKHDEAVPDNDLVVRRLRSGDRFDIRTTER